MSLRYEQLIGLVCAIHIIELHNMVPIAACAADGLLGVQLIIRSINTKLPLVF